jgi:hypothetical protein
MQPSDRAEFLRTLNGLAAIKGKELTGEAIALWWAAMTRWTIEDFKSAASHLVSACQFMPTPFDFEQLKRAGESTPSEAWAVVLAGEKLEGRALRAANLIGGQYAIRHTHVDQLPFLAKRFREAYEELADVERTREELPQIAAPDSPRLLAVAGALRSMK